MEWEGFKDRGQGKQRELPENETVVYLPAMTRILLRVSQPLCILG